MNARHLVFLCLAWCFLVAASPAPPAVKHFKGRVVGFAAADYVYAVVCIGDSSELFGVSSPNAGLFVAAHPGVVLDLEVSVIGRDTLDTGAVEIEYGLTGASLNGYNADTWWSDIESVLGYERARDLFHALEESLTVYVDYGLPPPSCQQGLKGMKVRR